MIGHLLGAAGGVESVVACKTLQTGKIHPTIKGVVIVSKGDGVSDEDDVLMAVLDAGAEEVNDLGDSFEVVSEATDLVAVRTALQEAGIDYDSADRPVMYSLEWHVPSVFQVRVYRRGPGRLASEHD